MRYFLLFILTLFALEVFSQRKVSGIVMDTEGTGMPGVNFHLDGHILYPSASDLEGRFNIITHADTCILSFWFPGLKPEWVRITQDTIISVVLGYDKYDTKWLSIGANYDVVNFLFGVTFSNGYDEMPLIHFEDFSDRVIYKINVHTNFHKDYSFGANLGWRYPFTSRIRRLSLLSAGYQEHRYPSKNFIHRTVHISAETFLKSTEIKVNTGYQTLNDYNNWGASVGLEKSIIYSKLLAGISAGYYFNYCTYSLYFQGFFTSKNVSFRLAYDRIDTFDFFIIGLNYFISK